MTPTQQIKHYGLNCIPPFLRRPKPPKNWRPSYAAPATHVIPGGEPFRAPLTDHDQEVIAELLAKEQGKRALKLEAFKASLPPRQPSQRKAQRSTMVDMKVIAATLKVEPRIARQALRDLGLEKPSLGWVFLQSEVDSIIAKIRTVLPAPKAQQKK